jgi:hypothetical protein
MMIATPKEETPQQAFKRACEHLGIDYNTPASHLNAGQLFMLGWFAKGGMPQPEAKEYLFGLKGIETEFGVSHKCAQAWKNTWLAPAIEQTGKVILCDKAMAHELFKQRKEGRK